MKLNGTGSPIFIQIFFVLLDLLFKYCHLLNNYLNSIHSLSIKKTKKRVNYLNVFFSLM